MQHISNFWWQGTSTQYWYLFYLAAQQAMLDFVTSENINGYFYLRHSLTATGLIYLDSFMIIYLGSSTCQNKVRHAKIVLNLTVAYIDEL